MDQQTVSIIVALIAGLLGSGMTGLIQFFILRHDRKILKDSEAKSAQTQMLLGLGHDKILTITDKIVERGSITLKEKRNLDYLYLPYVKMGGNGDCKIGYEACQKLDVIPEEVALELDKEQLKKFCKSN